MFDEERLSLDPREGEHISGSNGERAVVAIALLALVGGLFIVAANFIGSLASGTAADASSSAEPTERPDRTPRPSPTPRPLREFTVDAGIPPMPRVIPTIFSGFIEPLQDLIIRDGATADGAEVGVLPQGRLASAEDRSSSDRWLYVTTPNGHGWIDTGEDGAPTVTRIEPEQPVGTEVQGVAAGDDGFISVGWRPTEDNPYGPVVLASADGMSWRETSFEVRGAWSALVAWGPAGWLAITGHESASGGMRAWLSQLEGDRWAPMGGFSVVDFLYPEQLVGSELGYLYMAQDGGRSGTDSRSLWFSIDGSTWRESEPLDLGGDEWASRRIAAVPGGFYAWSPQPGGSAAFSANGRAWTPVEDGPLIETMQLVGVGDGIVAIDLDPASGSVRAWSGAIDGATVTWARRQRADAAFTGAGVGSLIGDGGSQAIALGGDLDTAAPLTWTLHDDTWVREPLPAEFDGDPRIGAVGGDGAVIVGYRPSVRTNNPIFWHRSGDAPWAPEPSPVVVAVPDPTAADCEPRFADGLAMLYIERGLAVGCQGDTPVTFTAWADSCSECQPRSETGEESFLLSGRGFLSFGIGPNIGWPTSGILDPERATEFPLGTGTIPGWVEVTGHFDDPRAQECRMTPIPPEYGYYSSQFDMVRGCRLQFVVTALTQAVEP